MRSGLLLVIATALACGCTPAVYRDWADRDVARVLESRTDVTLGYVPEVQITDDFPVDVDEPARNYVPLTLRPVDAPVPIGIVPEAARVGAFGPPLPPEAIDEADLSATLDATALARQFATEGTDFGPPAAGFDVATFGLADSLAYATEHSRDYRDEMEDLYLAALDVTLARHLFEPRFFADGTVRYERASRSRDFATALETVTRAGVRQRLPYGGEVSAAAVVSFVDALDGPVADGESAAVTLEASVPLLRGAGFVNLEPLVQGERDVVYAVRDFERFRRAFAVEVAGRYFNLVNLRQSVRNNYINFLQNQRLVDQVQAQFDAGFNDLRIIEVQRAVNSLLRAEDALNGAQARYENALDDFKIVLGMPVQARLDIVAQAVDVEAVFERQEAAVAAALDFRLDLQTQRDQVDDARRGVAVTRNQLLPTLDLVGDATVGNEDDDPARELDRDTALFGAGVAFSLPLDRVAERNDYRRSLIRLEQAQRAVDDLEARVTADVRQALRNVRQAEISVRISEANAEVARRRLEYAVEALRLGVAGVETVDVVDAQDALLSANQQLDAAKADLLTERLQLLRDTGTLRVDPAAGLLGTALDFDGTGNAAG